MEYQSKEVFTPTTQAILTYIERQKNELNDDLIDALETPGMQIVLYGHSGTGKSTLILNVIKRIYSNHIVTRCTSDMTYENLILNAFDQLNPFYKISQTDKTGKSITLSLTSEYQAIKGSLSSALSKETVTTTQRFLPPQLTAQRLAEFIGELKQCWIIEDFHKIKEQEKVRLSQQLKVFVDTAIDYPEVKAILIGAVNTAREVIEYDREMTHRVAEISVPLMDDNELHEILEKGEKLLNIKFSQLQKNDIVRFSSGLASITHQIALNMCLSKDIRLTQNNTYSFLEEDFQNAIKKYINKSSDSLGKRYDRATKSGRVKTYNNGKIILYALANFSSEEVQQAELLIEIKKDNPQYRGSNLSIYINQLLKEEKGEFIKVNRDNGKYSFIDPFAGAYVKARKAIELKEKNPKVEKRKILESMELLTSMIIQKIHESKPH